MARPSVELIVGYTKAGKPQYKKFLAKQKLTLFDTIQGSKLAMKLEKVFASSDFDELSEDEFEQLSETEKQEYNAKIQEHQANLAQQFDLLDEITEYIAEAFGHQFTAVEFQKGIENGEEGFAKLSNVLGSLISGDVDDTKKFVSEKKK